MTNGNTELYLKEPTDEIKYDKNGKRILDYKTRGPITGWLDLLSGDSRYDYKAKIEDSTHIFICDFEDLGTLDIEETKATINDKEFDVKFIDDPMELHQHLEIYLKKVGGQNAEI